MMGSSVADSIYYITEGLINRGTYTQNIVSAAHSVNIEYRQAKAHLAEEKLGFMLLPVEQ